MVHNQNRHSNMIKKHIAVFLAAVLIYTPLTADAVIASEITGEADVDADSLILIDEGDEYLYESDDEYHYDEYEEPDTEYDSGIDLTEEDADTVEDTDQTDEENVWIDEESDWDEEDNDFDDYESAVDDEWDEDGDSSESSEESDRQRKGPPQYERPRSLPEFSGKWRDDFIEVAMSQEGYSEACDGSSYFAAWLGSAYGAWCVEFVSWCAYSAGISDSVIPREATTRKLMEFYAPRGRFYCVDGGIDSFSTQFMEEYGYKLQTIEPSSIEPGDLLLFDMDKNPGDGPDHVGICLSVDGDIVENISGNNDDSVMISRRSISSLHGVLKPDFSACDPDVKPLPGMLSYSTRVQNAGWQNWKADGEVAGTSGMMRQLEGIKVELSDAPYYGGIRYRTYLQDAGWQDWKQDGEASGTDERRLRLEAVSIELCGDMELYYDVYYRAYVQNLGWMDWASNGEIAGTEGMSLRLEALQIVLAEKGDETVVYKLSHL